jgi:flagellar protein FlaF
MGAGTIIASAIVIVLLIITGYVLIGGTLSTAQIVMVAQRAAAEKEGQRIHTQIEIMNASANLGVSETFIEVKNTGSEVIGDFDHMEVYLLQNQTPDMYIPYTYTILSAPFNFVYRITPLDLVHPGLLDPDEVANITVLYDAGRGDPSWVKVTTANGVYDSAYLPCSLC